LGKNLKLFLERFKLIAADFIPSKTCRLIKDMLLFPSKIDTVLDCKNLKVSLSKDRMPLKSNSKLIRFGVEEKLSGFKSCKRLCDSETLIKFDKSTNDPSSITLISLKSKIMIATFRFWKVPFFIISILFSCKSKTPS